MDCVAPIRPANYMSTTREVTVGKPAPDFNATAVVDGRLKEVSLSSYTSANHWLILIFFPRAWSFICPTEIKAFSARVHEFLYNRQCAVIFCSTDSEYCLKAWNASPEMEGGLEGIHVPMLSDHNQKISRDYGVLVEEAGVAQRGLFIIDPKGIIRAMNINDIDVGRSVDETQRILDALRFKDEFGEGCPIDWKKGDKGVTIKSAVDGPIKVGNSPTGRSTSNSISSTIKSWTDRASPKLYRTISTGSMTGGAATSNPNSPIRNGNGNGNGFGHMHTTSLGFVPSSPLASPSLSMRSDYFSSEAPNVVSTAEAEEMRKQKERMETTHNHVIGVAN